MLIHKRAYSENVITVCGISCVSDDIIDDVNKFTKLNVADVTKIISE